MLLLKAHVHNSFLFRILSENFDIFILMCVPQHIIVISILSVGIRNKINDYLLSVFDF